MASSKQLKVMTFIDVYSLFLCQDKDKNETKNESFRSFWIMPVTNEPSPWYYITLNFRFVRHRFVSEHTRTKESFGFGFCLHFCLGRWTGYYLIFFGGGCTAKKISLFKVRPEEKGGEITCWQLSQMRPHYLSYVVYHSSQHLWRPIFQALPRFRLRPETLFHTWL